MFILRPNLWNFIENTQSYGQKSDVPNCAKQTIDIIWLIVFYLFLNDSLLDQEWLIIVYSNYYLIGVATFRCFSGQSYVSICIEYPATAISIII